MGRPLRLTVGAPIASNDLEKMARDKVASHLRRQTMALSGAQAADTDEVFIWPAHVKW
jgi:hypothetical protein